MSSTTPPLASSLPPSTCSKPVSAYPSTFHVSFLEAPLFFLLVTRLTSVANSIKAQQLVDRRNLKDTLGDYLLPCPGPSDQYALSFLPKSTSLSYTHTHYLEPKLSKVLDPPLTRNPIIHNSVVSYILHASYEFCSQPTTPPSRHKYLFNGSERCRNDPAQVCGRFVFHGHERLHGLYSSPSFAFCCAPKCPGQATPP